MTTLYTFSGGADGGRPYSDLTEGSDGNFYGTTDSTVFTITSAGTFTTLATFGATGPLPTVSVSAIGDGKAVVGEENGKVLFSRTGDTSSDLNVPYTIAGTAVEGVDYEALPSSGNPVIPAGSSSIKIKIKPIADPAANASTFAKIKLSAPAGGAYALGFRSKAKITILQH